MKIVDKNSFTMQLIKYFYTINELSKVREEINSANNSRKQMSDKIKALSFVKDKLEVELFQNNGVQPKINEIKAELEKLNKSNNKITDSIRSFQNKKYELENTLENLDVNNVMELFNNNKNYDGLTKIVDKHYTNQLKFYSFPTNSITEDVDDYYTNSEPKLIKKNLLLSEDLYEKLKSQEGKLSCNQIDEIENMFRKGNLFERKIINLDNISLWELDSNTFKEDISSKKYDNIIKTANVIFDFANDYIKENTAKSNQILKKIVNDLNDKIEYNKDFSIIIVQSLLNDYKELNNNKITLVEDANKTNTNQPTDDYTKSMHK